MTEVNITLPRKNFELEINQQFSDGITGIFGPSGSGKTSLLQSLSGLTTPKRGRIVIGDKVVFDAKQKINVPVEKRNIGYVFQEGRLFPHMSVEKNLMYGFKIKGNKEIGFDEVVDMLGLAHILNSKPAQISGGERQRTALGRSLLSSPDILLLDEPFSAVDMSLRNQILPFILRIQKKVNIPILVVSHDIPDLLKLTETLFIMQKGKCLGHGEYYQLLKEPAIADIFRKGAIVNAIHMDVLNTNAETGLTLLGYKLGNQEIIITCDKSKEIYKEGQQIKIFINADDIALSTEKSSTISIQNQVMGTVKDIIRRGTSLLYIVDAGFKLVVEVTAESQSRMGIKLGSQVWCLFKSVAIDVAS